jgi:acyl-CoA synthetase (NDP forming)
MDNTNTVIELRESLKGNDYQDFLSCIKGPYPSEMDINDILLKAKMEERSYLMEHESKQILEGFGIQTSGSMIAKDEGDAVEIARYLGYPVVLKIVSPDVVHKSDLGGVKLDLRNDLDVRKAYTEIISQFKGKDIIGVSVQKMASPGIDAIIGVTLDETFGPVIMFGLGGVFVEVLKDVCFRVLPITEAIAGEMIEEIRGYPLLKGYRGRSADIPSLRELLVKVSSLIMKYPEIRELDMNPWSFILWPSGNRCQDVYDQPYHLLKKPTLEDSVSKEDLHRLFYPQSIAVLGATESQGKLGFNVIWNLISHNFPYKLYPVNPRKESILGLKSYSSILDIMSLLTQR